MKKAIAKLLMALTVMMFTVGMSDAQIRIMQSNGGGNSGGQQTHQYVDLGLPSGTLWATCNVGANNPWEYGDSFEWGEITTNLHLHSSLHYKYSNGNSFRLTKYCTLSSCGNNGFVDNKTLLEFSDDAAYQNWGSDWCMPMHSDFEELTKLCNCVFTNQNGQNGYLVTGPNGNSIFLPAKKNMDSGKYWSRSVVEHGPNCAWCLMFDKWSLRSDLVVERFNGFQVRPVVRRK